MIKAVNEILGKPDNLYLVGIGAKYVKWCEGGSYMILVAQPKSASSALVKTLGYINNTFGLDSEKIVPLKKIMYTGIGEKRLKRGV